MKKGFTLAEVLITLAIIGVVAALTIPVVVHNYQKKALYTQFMKAYNTISSAMDLITVDHGSISGWNWGYFEYNDETEEFEMTDEGDNPFANYIAPALKAVQICEDSTDCLAESYTDLSGTKDVSKRLMGYNSYGSTPAVVLSDGSVFAVRNAGNYAIYFTVDTNGKKGPNVLGRDVFVIGYGRGEYDYDAQDGILLDAYSTDTTLDSSNNVKANCDPNITNSGYTNGIGCAQRLIQEGKMNY